MTRPSANRTKASILASVCRITGQDQRAAVYEKQARKIADRYLASAPGALERLPVKQRLIMTELRRAEGRWVRVDRLRDMTCPDCQLNSVHHHIRAMRRKGWPIETHALGPNSRGYRIGGAHG